MFSKNTNVSGLWPFFGHKKPFFSRRKPFYSTTQYHRHHKNDRSTRTQDVNNFPIHIKLKLIFSPIGWTVPSWKINRISRRLRAVPHFSSEIVERAKRERQVKITPREKRRHLFSRGVIFTRARVSLALLSLRKSGGLLVVYISHVAFVECWNRLWRRH